MGEVTEKSFSNVKEYVVEKYPEFENIVLEVCDECEKDYIESKEERAGDGLDPRVFAHAIHQPFIICYNERMDEELEEAERQGILVHEFGHLYDARHPDEFASFDDPEMRADLISFSKFRVPINYIDGRDIQTIELPIGSEEVSDEDAIAIFEDVDEELSGEELEEILEEIEEDEGPESMESMENLLDTPLNAPILEPEVIEPDIQEPSENDIVEDAELNDES